MQTFRNGCQYISKLHMKKKWAVSQIWEFARTLLLTHSLNKYWVTTLLTASLSLRFPERPAKDRIYERSHI